MDERSARDVVLVHAIETADAARETWTDDDRAWALRTAGAIVGEHAPPDLFLARRAALALERLRARFPRLAALSALPPASGMVGTAIAAGAFLVGAAGASVGPSRTINLLAPPVLALFAWNLAVYAGLLFHALSRPRDRSGPLRAAVARWLRGARRASGPRGAPPVLAVAFRGFAMEWTKLALPLWQQRAARLLHLGAACLALGMIAGLYLRGVALEFRANWQSTFLDAADVSRILRIVLAPGAWLTGLPVPDERHVATLGGAGAGENAAAWIHLYAATMLVVVILPRLALAGVAWFREHRLASRFPLPLDAPYFARLLRAWREGPGHVLVVSYGYDPPSASRSGLERVLARSHDGSADVEWAPTVAYGDDALPDPGTPTAIVALFNFAATPERENQGAFAETLRVRAPAGVPVVALVDTSAFVERFGADARRIGERERAWRSLLEPAGLEPLFVRLVDADTRGADDEFARRLDRVT